MAKMFQALWERVSGAWEGLLIRMGAKPSTRKLMNHWLELLWQQLAAMLPITLLQVLVLAIFFKKTTPTPLLEAAGLISAVIGLVLFLDGLRVAVMPMAMQVGTCLPMKLHLAWVLLVAFCLGVLVTYAEPAIAAIRPLAALVDSQSAPYLYYLMNQQQEIMVLAIGIGVGVAAVIGTLKFLYNWSLKICIAGTLVPTLAAACYMQWGNPHLRPLLGVAWDCGAVTTGPVTVPVLLSLGVGVMTAQKQKRLALAVLQEAAVNKSEGNSLEGFGIVTLASLLPILAVELMAIITSAIHPYEKVVSEVLLHSNNQKAAEAELPIADQSPVKEVVYGVRAISPLIVALILLVAVVLRQPIPLKGFVVEEEEEEEHGLAGGEEDKSGRSTASGSGSVHNKGITDKDVEQGRDQVCADSSLHAKDSSNHGRKAAGSTVVVKGDQVHVLDDRVGRVPSVAVAVIAAAGAKDMEYYDVSFPDDGSSSGCGISESGDSTASSNRSKRMKETCSKYASFIAAVLMCQVGMILFNLGLTYGFSALGDITGTTLPSAFLEVPYEPGSPFYSYAGGITLTMVTIFLLGVLATRAEPALNVLGETVEELSHKQFTKQALIWAVCFGVAIGMCAGACKILFQWPLIYFILAKYAVACGLTVLSKESITAVAWDSAGVTTGPVTVPFVLAIGIGFSTAVGAPEGFGMLTVMSVAPIISVLATSLMKKPVKKAVTQLQRISKQGLDRVSKTLHAGSRHGDGQVIDFAADLKNSKFKMAKAKLSQKQLEELEGPAEASQLSRIGEHSMRVPDTKGPCSPPAGPSNS